MKSFNSTQTHQSRAGWVPVLLAVILGLLFWKSFNPSFVFFSNDGPLGEQNTAWTQAPQCIGGMWDDLNSIGFTAGAFAPSASGMIRWVAGPVGYAKFYAPIALFILGIGAWTFFRQLKLTPLAATLGALAAALCSTFFSDACWGVASHQIAFGMDFFALALITSNSPTTPWLLRWTRLALAGLAVGMNVMEAADIGAIFSLFVAAFTLFHSFAEDGLAIKKLGRGVGRIAVIAIFAAFFAAQTIISLVGTQIEGIVGTQQNEETKAEHWNWATQWSLPKIETFGIVVPGLFGYRMDTPDGGNYWGAVGRDPSWDHYLANGEQGSPQGFHALLAARAIMPVSWFFWWLAGPWLNRCGDRILFFPILTDGFSGSGRRCCLFHCCLAFGRFAPFYHLVYVLPYFSTIRNPVKFLFVFSWAMVIIFAYGIHGLSRRYLEIPATGSASPLAQFKAWWTKAPRLRPKLDFDLYRCLDRQFAGVVDLCVAKAEPGRLFENGGFSDDNMAGHHRRLQYPSSRLVHFVLRAGRRIARVDFQRRIRRTPGQMGRNSSGHIARRGSGTRGSALDCFLELSAKIRQQSHCGSSARQTLRTSGGRCRSCTRNSAFRRTFTTSNGPSNFSPITTSSRWTSFRCRACRRIWRLIKAAALAPTGQRRTVDVGSTSPAGGQLQPTPVICSDPPAYLDSLNQQFDPVQHRFRIAQRFNVVPKPGIENPTQYSELTAVSGRKRRICALRFHRRAAASQVVFPLAGQHERQRHAANAREHKF